MFDQRRVMLLLFRYSHAHIQTLTLLHPTSKRHFHLFGKGVRQATALGSLLSAKEVMLNSEFTDSSPEVSLLNTKRAAG